jgi:DnaD/phage-associated family protein
LTFTAIPDLFFSELLPQIDDLAELKVTLHVMWTLHHRKSEPSGKPAARFSSEWISQAELERDGLLLQSLAAAGADAEQALHSGLAKAVQRGVLLRVQGESPSGPPHLGVRTLRDVWYLVNSSQGRKTLEALRAGRLTLPEGQLVAEQRPLPEKLNVFALYEQNIGPLQPIIAEELEEAQQLYPEGWVEEAFRIAAENNARSWRYVRAILERWHSQGKDSPGQSEGRDRKRFISGEYEEYQRL